jgi:SNF2 family DNA or RNA helicase
MSTPVDRADEKPIQAGMVVPHDGLLRIVANRRLQGTLRTLLLDKSMTPFDLRAYDVIVTSYSFITSEAARLAKFDRCMAEYEKKKTHIVPTRPKVTLFSGIWKMDGVQHIGRFLAFDEAHTIKNHSGRAFAAARTLRAIFSVVILATGTMLDNTWADAFALVSMLAGHPFTTMLRMRETFTDALKRNPRPKNLNTCVPEGVKLERLVHFLHAFTLSRPSSTVTGDMEPLKQCLVEFDLTKEDRENSNKAYRLYNKSMKIVSGDAAWGGHADADGEPRIKWGEQIKATQFAFHPSLPRIMELYRKADNTRRSMMSEVKFKAHQLLTPKEKLEWEEWRTMIREGDNCLSERVDAILDIINLSRDRRPGDSILILDESAYFLEILEVAITTMHDPLPVFRYTGDQEPAERHVTLTAFVASAGIRTSVMLSTRGAGGQGLNLQCANVVIRCGPWWKRSWEEQAVARCFRYGQTKPVWAYELKANDCEVEVYKRGLRKSKNAINEAIMKLVTLEDGAPLPVWSEQRADEYSAEDFDGDVDLEGEGVGNGSQPQQIEGGGNGSFVDEAAFLLPHASTLDATDLLGPDDMMEDD